MDARASKLWRTLRVASKSRLSLFDKIDDGHDLQALFDFKTDENQAAAGDEDEEEGIGAENDIDRAAPGPSMVVTEQMENGVAMEGDSKSTDLKPIQESVQSAPSTNVSENHQDAEVK